MRFRQPAPHDTLAVHALLGGLVLALIAFVQWTNFPSVLVAWLLWMLLLLIAASLTAAVRAGVRALPTLVFLCAVSVTAGATGLALRAAVEGVWTWGVGLLLLMVGPCALARVAWRRLCSSVHPMA